MCYGACSNEQFVRQHMRDKTIFFKKWPSTGLLIPCHHLPRALGLTFCKFSLETFAARCKQCFLSPRGVNLRSGVPFIFAGYRGAYLFCSRSLTHRNTKNSGADPGEFSPPPPPPASLFLSPLLSFFFSLALKYCLVLLHYYKHPPPPISKS